MHPLTDEKPKGLVEVAGTPLLSHVFDALLDVDIAEFVVVVGYRGDQIREYYGDAYRGIPVTYAEQSERRGLGDAVLQAEPHVSGDFVVLNGDNVVRANVGEAVTRHRQTGADVTTLVERNPRRAGKGAVFELDSGEITGLVEKPEDPPSNLVPRGFYVFSERVFHACELVTAGETGERELTAAVDLLVTAGWRLETVELDGWCYNVNTPADRSAVADRLE